MWQPEENINNLETVSIVPTGVTHQNMQTLAHAV